MPPFLAAPPTSTLTQDTRTATASPSEPMPTSPRLRTAHRPPYTLFRARAPCARRSSSRPLSHALRVNRQQSTAWTNPCEDVKGRGCKQTAGLSPAAIPPWNLYACKVAAVPLFAVAPVRGRMDSTSLVNGHFEPGARTLCAIGVVQEACLVIAWCVLTDTHLYEKLYPYRRVLLSTHVGYAAHSGCREPVPIFIRVGCHRVAR